MTDFKPKTYRISSVGSILLEISHFSFLCQLKVLGHFAKNWFGKKFPVAVSSRIHVIYSLLNHSISITGFINLWRQKSYRETRARVLASLSDFSPPSAYKSHILNRTINKLYLIHFYSSVMISSDAGCIKTPLQHFRNVTYK